MNGSSSILGRIVGILIFMSIAVAGRFWLKAELEKLGRGEPNAFSARTDPGRGRVEVPPVVEAPKAAPRTRPDWISVDDDEVQQLAKDCRTKPGRAIVPLQGKAFVWDLSGHGLAPAHDALPDEIRLTEDDPGSPTTSMILLLGTRTVDQGPQRGEHVAQIFAEIGVVYFPTREVLGMALVPVQEYKTPVVYDGYGERVISRLDLRAVPPADDQTLNAKVAAWVSSLPRIKPGHASKRPK